MGYQDSGKFEKLKKPAMVSLPSDHVQKYPNGITTIQSYVFTNIKSIVLISLPTSVSELVMKNENERKSVEIDFDDLDIDVGVVDVITITATSI